MKYSVKSPQKGALTHFLSTFASMKTLTDTEYIHALIAEGEHQQQDFKFEISDARKIAKTLSAFANTDGGKLLIGVKDNGKIAGVRSDEEQYMIEAAAGLYCSPEVNYTMQTYQVEGRSVLVVQIEESDRKPVYAKDETGKYLAYLRIKDENILAHSRPSTCLATKRKSERRTDRIYRTGTAAAQSAGRERPPVIEPLLPPGASFPTRRRTSAGKVCSL